MSNKLIGSARQNKEAETNGVWRKFSADGATFYGVKLRRAGSTNPAFVKLAEELTRDQRNAGVDLSRVDPEKQKEITRRLYASAVVADWDAEAFGEPYTADACIRTFEEVNDFLDWCITEAQRASEYRAAAIAANSGN